MGPWRVGPAPGYCGAQDTFYVSNLKGVGLGLSADLHWHLHQGGLRQALRSQDAESAAHLLNDRVLQRIRFRCYSAAVNSAGS
jgi:hypothetical protein